MHIEVRQNGDVVIVDLKGKLTAGLGDQIFRETMDELVRFRRWFLARRWTTDRHLFAADLAGRHIDLTAGFAQ